MWSDFYERIQGSVASLKRFAATDFTPRAVITLGTGLGQLKDNLVELITISYNDIPAFVPSIVHSHEGNLILGYWHNIPVAMLSGRIHLYEGHHPKQVTLPVRAMAHWGADTFIFTNAAGGLSHDMRAGDLMFINDHINLTGQNPLIGQHVPAWGPHFPDMSQAYDPGLLNLARQAAAKENIKYHEGVYVGLTGPSLETPAETRMLKMLGGRAVGMSTVLEVIVARQHQARVLGLSAITNVNDPDNMEEITLQDIVFNAQRAGKDMRAIISYVLAHM